MVHSESGGREGPLSQGLQSAQAGTGRGPEAPRPGLPAAESVQHAVHIVLPAQALEERDEVQQLRVRHVIEPGLHRHLQDSVSGPRGDTVTVVLLFAPEQQAQLVWSQCWR